MSERDHGSWYFYCSVRDLLGKVERVRRGGYPSEAAARRARDELLTLSREEQAGRSWTVARRLRYWLSTRSRIRPTTRMHYTQATSSTWSLDVIPGSCPVSINSWRRQV
ncbi:hypothetical protein [Plantactinospora veratri]